MSKANLPSVLVVGSGASGLWTAMALIERGYTAANLTLVDPDAKASDDHTWGYWGRHSLLPESVQQLKLSSFVVRNGDEMFADSLRPYSYYSVRSGHFYAFAKQVLAQSGIKIQPGFVERLSENADEVTVNLADGSRIAADYVLDSRLPTIDVADPSYNATLQHFGGWFVEAEQDMFAAGEIVLMDFTVLPKGCGFFYVVPYDSRTALIELAVLSDEIWTHQQYDEALREYMEKRYPPYHYTISEREYGAIPMTDEPLWRDSTARIWKIGTSGGWVQPSSGYAFARCAAFAQEVAQSLASGRPQPWTPSPVQQTFNSVMLNYIIERPQQTGQMFVNWFSKNGAEQAFDFLSEDTGFADTIRLMWNSPKLEFTPRAIQEVGLRLIGKK